MNEDVIVSRPATLLQEIIDARNDPNIRTLQFELQKSRNPPKIEFHLINKQQFILIYINQHDLCGSDCKELDHDGWLIGISPAKHIYTEHDGMTKREASIANRTVKMLGDVVLYYTPEIAEFLSKKFRAQKIHYICARNIVMEETTKDKSQNIAAFFTSGRFVDIDALVLGSQHFLEEILSYDDNKTNMLRTLVLNSLSFENNNLNGMLSAMIDGQPMLNEIIVTKKIFYTNAFNAKIGDNLEKVLLRNNINKATFNVARLCFYLCWQSQENQLLSALPGEIIKHILDYVYASIGDKIWSIKKFMMMPMLREPETLFDHEIRRLGFLVQPDGTSRVGHVLFRSKIKDDKLVFHFKRGYDYFTVNGVSIIREANYK